MRKILHNIWQLRKNSHLWCARLQARKKERRLIEAGMKGKDAETGPQHSRPPRGHTVAHIMPRPSYLFLKDRISGGLYQTKTHNKMLGRYYR